MLILVGEKQHYSDDNFRVYIEGIKSSIAKEFSLLLQELEKVRVN